VVREKLAASSILVRFPMRRLSPRHLRSLAITLGLLAVPTLVAVFAAAPGCPNCGGWQ
jgi:hypothetical protein